MYCLILLDFLVPQWTKA